MNMNHNGPVNMKAESGVLVDDTEELICAPDEKDPSFVKSVSQIESQPEVEGYHERLQW